MVNESIKLKCQLSDQKQTPLYFPINKEKKIEKNISLEQKKKIINGYIAIAIVMFFINTSVIIVTYFRQEIFESYVLTRFLSFFKGKILGLMVCVLLIGFISWEFFKYSTSLNKDQYNWIAIGYILSCLMCNIGSFILFCKLKTLGIIDDLKKLGICMCFFIFINGLMISRWFLE